MPQLARRLFHSVLGAAGLVVLLAAPAFAQHGQTALNITADGLALRGHDPVAYFTEAQAVLGRAEFVATHGGATYRFVTAAHRDLFVASPESYLPQYGGYCAMGVAIGKKLDGDPMLWRVVDGKLYLNVNEDAQRMWLRNPAREIGRADGNWSVVKARRGFDTM